MAILIVLVTIGLHSFFRAHIGGFWRDEVNLINLAQGHSIGDMRKDSFPLLMPLLIHSWFGLGLSEPGLRWLGFFIGMGTLVALLFSTWKINRTPPLFGLVLLGLNSTLIVYGDSMRAYGLGCVFIILTTFCAGHFLSKPDWKRAGWLTLTSVASVQTLYHNSILVGAICLGSILVLVRRQNWADAAKVFGAGAVAAISLLPYVPNLLAGRESSATLRTGLKTSRLIEGFMDGFGFPLEQYTYIWGILAALLLLFCCRSIGDKTSPDESDARRRNQDLLLFAVATFFIGLVGTLIFLKLAAYPAQSWYLLPLMAVAITCLDISWPLWPRQTHLPIFGFAMATALIAVPIAIRDLDYHFTNIDIWSRQMKTEVAPEDYVIVLPWFCGITFAHDFKNPTAWDTLPPISDHTVHRFDLVKMEMQDTNAIVPLLQKVTATLQSGHRVWILAQMGCMDVPEPGTTAAATLPPAPYAPVGWSEVPYTWVWISQVAHYVGDHTTQFGRVKNPTAGQRIAENAELFCASGWRDSTNPVPAR